MATPSPDLQRVKQKLREAARKVGRPASPFTEAMVDVGSSLRAFQPMVGMRRRFDGTVEILPSDEIITRKGWDEYRKMLHDPQVSSTLEFKKLMVYGRKWDVLPASKDQEDKDVAEFVSKALRKTDFKGVLREALTAFEYGFCLGELIWKLDTVDKQQAIILEDVKFRDPEFITCHVDKHGNIEQWEQDVQSYSTLQANEREIFLKPNKVLHWANDKKFGNHYGRSDLRAAYRSWWAKKFIIQFWSVFLERMGQPMMMMKYPQGASETLKAALRKILSGLSTKTEILVPMGVEVELIEATRAGTATYEEALDYHDREIARALLMVALLGAGGNAVKRGSDSQSRLHLRTLHKMADEIGMSILTAINKQIVKQLVDFNFDVEEYPTVYFQDYGEFESFEITDAIRLLHAAGILELDQEDVNFARSILNLPIRDEDNEDKVVRPPEPPPPGSANAPPPAAEQGNQRGASGRETPGTSQ